MIEQELTSLLSKKGSGNFSAWVIEACRPETNVRKRHIHQLKVMKNEHPAFFHLEQDDVVNSLNYEGIAMNLGCSFYHFPDSDRLRVGSVTD